MEHRELMAVDLERIICQVAGENGELDLAGRNLDSEFAELGYDSVALLEVGSQIEHELGIRLDEEKLGSATTPRALLTVVNDATATP